jgi:hypothetical protein
MNANVRLLALALAGLGWVGCASISKGTKTPDRIALQPGDRVFLRVAPFDTTVKTELARIGLDPEKTWQDLSDEMRYQFFLKKQEESPDSAGSTVRVEVALRHLRPGAGNAGDFFSGTLTAERDGTVERADWETRNPARENVPPEFMALRVPRALAGEILSRMKARPRRASSEMDYPPPLILLH